MRYVSGKIFILKIAQIMRKYRDRQTLDDVNIMSFELSYSTLCVNCSGRLTTINFMISASKFPKVVSDSIPFFGATVCKTFSYYYDRKYRTFFKNTPVEDFKVLIAYKKNRCFCGLPNFLVSGVPGSLLG
jgi:hypothetical protein